MADLLSLESAEAYLWFWRCFVLRVWLLWIWGFLGLLQLLRVVFAFGPATFILGRFLLGVGLAGCGWGGDAWRGTREGPTGRSFRPLRAAFLLLLSARFGRLDGGGPFPWSFALHWPPTSSSSPTTARPPSFGRHALHFWLLQSELGFLESCLGQDLNVLFRFDIRRLFWRRRRGGGRIATAFGASISVVSFRHGFALRVFSWSLAVLLGQFVWFGCFTTSTTSIFAGFLRRQKQEQSDQAKRRAAFKDTGSLFLMFTGIFI